MNTNISEEDKEQVKQRKREYARLYRLNNKEKVKADNKNWRNNNKEKMQVYLKQWREKNKEKCKSDMLVWLAKNKERKIISDRNWKKKNPDKVKKNAKRYSSKHSASIAERSKKWVEANPEKQKARVFDWKNRNPLSAYRSSLKRKFNITLDEYNSMLYLQKGVCYLCGGINGKNRLCVDHCHKTNKIRALLCSNCNFGLGHADDNKLILASAICYIRQYENKVSGIQYEKSWRLSSVKKNLLEEQDYKCAICFDKVKKAYIDHDHVSNLIRAILCISCNALLGNFKEDVVILQKAIDYLTAYDSIKQEEA